MDLKGNPIPDDQILGNGASGLVVRHDGLAIKIPLRYPWTTPDEVQLNVQVVWHKQDVYCCLNQKGSCHSIVCYVGFSETTTELVLMENGDLHAYLERNRLSQTLQLSWFHKMARTLAFIHDQHVIVADIASHNFLLDSTLSIKFYNFTESTILLLDTDIEAADDNGYSIQTDIGQLGAVMYELQLVTSVTLISLETMLPITAELPGHDKVLFPAPKAFGLAQSLRCAGPKADSRMCITCWSH